MSNPNLVALGTIVRREVARILRIWGQTLMPPAITMTLYFLIFGGLIGSKIGDMGGYSYMQFIVPGLVMMSVIQNSYGNISSSFFGAKFGRHIEELLVSPMPNWVILGGYVAGAVLRGVMVGAIVLCIAMFFTQATNGKRRIHVGIAKVVLQILTVRTIGLDFTHQQHTTVRQRSWVCPYLSDVV